MFGKELLVFRRFLPNVGGANSPDGMTGWTDCAGETGHVEAHACIDHEEWTMSVLFRWSWLGGLALGLSLGLLSAKAEEPVTVAKPATKPLLPEVFSKSVPGSVAELKALESHVRQLLPQLSAATVAVQIREAHGSGVIVSAKGLIMTAGHVSGKPGREVEVTLADGTQVKGRTLGRNRILDTGLIQIDGDRADWPFCEPVSRTEAKSATQLGDWCLSLGHPGGYQAGRTAPVRLGRVIVQMHRLMQTDCELVGGDSGGPLFNMRGEVIGINSRIGAGLDFNFHVPTRAFQQEWDSLVQSKDLDGTEDLDGDGRHGALLGLSGQTDTAGLKVTKVYEDEPAAWAGIRVGDLLVTLDAKRITDMNQLIEQVGEKLPGDEVQIELLRNGKKIELTVELDLKWD